MPDSRLHFDGQAGRLMAHRAGVQILIRPAAAADLPRELRRAVELEFWPAQRWCWVRETDRLREMTAAEETLVRGWLDRLIAGVRGAHLAVEAAHG